MNNDGSGGKGYVEKREFYGGAVIGSARIYAH